MKQEKVNIEFELSNIPNNSLALIGQTLKFIEFFYHNTINVNKYQKTPLPTEEFPFMIDNSELSLEEFRNESYLWLSKKALEDFVLGINLCLVEANKLKGLSELAEASAINPIDVKEEIVKLDKKVNTLNFPTLILRIEEWLGISPFPLRSEIESINKVRACFAHRNGRVNGQKDINDKIDSRLKIQWVEFSNEIQLQDESWEKLTFEIRKNGADIKAIRNTEIQKEVSFGIDELVKIDINILNGIGLTCIKFTQNLYTEITKKLKIKSK